MARRRTRRTSSASGPVRVTMQRVLRAPARGLVSRERLSRLIGILLLLWLAWLVFAGDTSLVNLWKLKRENRDLQGQMADLERRLEEIDQAERNLDNPEYLERMVREKYGLVRDGETCYHLVDPPDAAGDGSR